MTSERLIWLDCLRLMAGLSMVGLHCTADPSGLPWADYSESERIGPLLIRAILYTARTELFFLISIFLLLLSLDRRPRSYLETLAEQAQRLLIPFLFWTFFYAGFGLLKASQFGYFDAALAQLSSPLAWLGFFLLGDVKYHMHFLPTLFGLLLFYPLFRLAVKYPILGIAVLLCLLARQHLDDFLYGRFWGTDALGYLVRIVKVTTYVGYGLVAGAAVGLWQRHRASRLAEWSALIVFSGVILFAFKLIATLMAAETGEWSFGYAPGYWADFLMPVVLFLGCMSFAYRHWPQLISTLARYSFGVYLCHPIVLDLCEIILLNTDLAPMSQVLFKILVTVSITWLLVIGLSKSKTFAWAIGLGKPPSFRLGFSNGERVAK